jgi:hypothetical protein
LAEVGTKSLADLSANTVYQPRSRADVRVWKQDLQHLVNLLAGEMGEGEPYRDARATLSRLFGEYVEIPEPKVTRRRQAATE